ncbi:MAG: hypothetical protein HPY64_09815 [Anaerolineae bacterium]|nr:hypothetical protein [Anaerolineae bacterium]
MTPRRLALIPGLLVLLVAIGCTGGSAAIPTVASLPTVTPTPLPVTPTITPPPTWTPAPQRVLSCGEVIAATAREVQTLCAGLSPGEACYISPRVEVILRPVTGQPVFSAPGDRIMQTLFSQIRTFPYESATNSWGMALLSVATRPGIRPDQAVGVLLYGDATVVDIGGGNGFFQNMVVLTGLPDPYCTGGPLPAVILQTPPGATSDHLINGVLVRLQGTLLIRAPARAAMVLALLSGRAEVSTADGGIEMPAGTQVYTTLGGASGFEPVGPLTLQPLSEENRAALPLAALPRAVAVSLPVLQTPQPVQATEIRFVRPPTRTPIPTATPLVPFVGTPPGGIYLTFSGKRLEPGTTATGTVPPGGSDSWVFTPRGLAPAAVDSFEVTALSDWDPILTIESATWGVYVPEYDSMADRTERYRASLAGSGGDWRITIRDADGGGGTYTIRYICLGACTNEPQGDG